MKTWNEFYDDYKKTQPLMVSPLDDCGSFKDFLIKIDKTGTGTLIKELFGADESYIDSPGDFHTDPSNYEHDIIYHYVCHAEERRLFDLWAFWVDNLRKCFDWTYDTSKQKENSLKHGGKED